jgi:hypothetical protein
MTSEGLGEVFKGDSVDMCAEKFPLVSMGGRAERQACADGERGPPSARAEIFTKLTVKFPPHMYRLFMGGKIMFLSKFLITFLA